MLDTNKMATIKYENLDIENVDVKEEVDSLEIRHHDDVGETRLENIQGQDPLEPALSLELVAAKGDKEAAPLEFEETDGVNKKEVDAEIGKNLAEESVEKNCEKVFREEGIYHTANTEKLEEERNLKTEEEARISREENLETFKIETVEELDKTVHMFEDNDEAIYGETEKSDKMFTKIKREDDEEPFTEMIGKESIEKEIEVEQNWRDILGEKEITGIVYTKQNRERKCKSCDKIVQMSVITVCKSAIILCTICLDVRVVQEHKAKCGDHHQREDCQRTQEAKELQNSHKNTLRCRTYRAKQRKKKEDLRNEEQRQQERNRKLRAKNSALVELIKLTKKQIQGVDHESESNKELKEKGPRKTKNSSWNEEC